MQATAIPQVPPPGPSPALIAPDLVKLIDLYWIALASIQNTLEDIAGSDGRGEYLFALRCKMIEIFQEMDDLLSGMAVGTAKPHRLAVALERGLPHFGISAEALLGNLLFTDIDAGHDRLQQALLSFGESVVSRLPGQIPDAQGPQGQGQTIRVMRNWSTAAAKTGDDIGFLAERFRDL